MCQLNVYCVSKDISKDKIIQIMNSCYEGEYSNCIDDEDLTIKLDNMYNFYTNAMMGCNCGSIISYYEEYKDNSLSLDEFEENLKISNIEILKEAKFLLNKDNYKELKEEYNEKREKLNKRLIETMIDTSKIYNDMVYEINAREDIDFEEKKRLIERDVNKYINKLVNENDKSEKRAKALKDYNDFLKNNKVMNCCVIYENNINYIDEEIERIEKENHHLNYEKEYESFLKFIDSILKYCKEIKIFSFWQDGDDIEFINNKEVKRCDLKIEDLIFLGYKELLTIKR